MIYFKRVSEFLVLDMEMKFLEPFGCSPCTVVLHLDSVF